MIALIEKHRLKITALCEKYAVERLGIFGSATRLDFNDATSDLDFLVEFHNLQPENAADRYLGLLVDLEDLFERKIDLVSYRAIRNPYFKEIVDSTRVLLYAA
jgi:predicted nucleotidyltransferase